MVQRLSQPIEKPCREPKIKVAKTLLQVDAISGHSIDQRPQFSTGGAQWKPPSNPVRELRLQQTLSYALLAS